tara:strand:+ start:14351 stop:16045 length:1695 start_codon:yes stop_codon:yes gene_type:complete
MSKVFNFGVCLDNEDPARAGRIRAIMDTHCPEENHSVCADAEYTKILIDEGITWSSDNEKKLALESKVYWSKLDPYVVLPMLPLFINQIPKPDESVQIILMNPENEFSNNFYIGPLISAPQDLEYQNSANGRKGTTKGVRVQGPKNITQSDSSSKVFASPQHISIDGRNNSDIIFSGEKNRSGEIVLRAGKFEPNEKDPDFPTNNKEVTTVQLTNFSTELNLVKETIEKIEAVKEKVKWLVEYDVYGEDTVWSEENLTGEINLYQVAPDGTEWVGDKGPTNLDVGVGTPFNPNGNPTPDKISATIKFGNQPISGVTSLINRFLIETAGMENQSIESPPSEEGLPSLLQPWYVKSGQLVTTGEVGEPSPTNQTLDLYPFYFRPSYKLYNYYTRGEDEKKRISTNVINGVNISGIDITVGSACLINKEDPQPDPKKTDIDIISTSENEKKRQGIINAMSNKILLYSYDSTIPGKNSNNPNNVNLNRPETGQNVGIDQENLVKMDVNETEPLVRGEQLVKLLSKIVDFLATHEHGNAGTAAKNPDLISEIRTLFNSKTFLNENIRIN